MGERDSMQEKNRYTKKKKYYKRLIEIKSRAKGWTVVELLSVNKGGTITIKTIEGHVIKRKIDHIRWSPSKRLIREGGEKPTARVKCFSKKVLRRKKRAQRKKNVKRNQKPKKTNGL